MKRPQNLAYWLDEKPPLGVTALSGLQHVGLVSIFLLVPVIACRLAGLAPEKIVDVLSLSMLVMAVGPVLQGLGRGGGGSGYLLPPIFAAPYLPARAPPAQAGDGLPLGGPGAREDRRRALAVEGGDGGGPRAAGPGTRRRRFGIPAAADLRRALPARGDARAQGGRPAAHVRHDDLRRRGRSPGLASVPAAAPFLPARGRGLRRGDDRRDHRHARISRRIRGRRLRAELCIARCGRVHAGA